VASKRTVRWSGYCRNRLVILLDKPPALVSRAATSVAFAIFSEIASTSADLAKISNLGPRSNRFSECLESVLLFCRSR
jgi:hypothetical protein